MEYVLLAVLAVLAFAVRWVGHREFTADMRIFYAWMDKIEAGGGFAALDQEIGNYNAPFLYIFAFLSYLPGRDVVKIKLAWFVFDALMVFFTYKIVKLRWPRSLRIPILAAVVMAFLPTVVIDSSVYGQCDSIWGAFGLGGLYFLLKGKDWWGVSFLTVALAFKPQAIFIFPVLALMILVGRARWRTLLAIPVVYVLLDLPAIIAGRDPVELLTLYSPSRQASIVSALTSQAANFYQFLPVVTRLETVKGLGYAFAAILVVGVLYTVVASRVKLKEEQIVAAAALFVMVVPYFLPGMHERYFYLADVLTLVLAFYVPRLWFVPLLEQVASLFSYFPFLFWDTRHGPFVSLKLLAAIMGATIVIVGVALLRGLLVNAQGGQGLLQLVGLDQNVAGLRPLGRPDDTTRLHEVHEPAGLGEADPELALKHGGGAELRGDDELDRLDK